MVLSAVYTLVLYHLSCGTLVHQFALNTLQSRAQELYNYRGNMMTFKYTCILLLVAVVFLSTQAKKEQSKQKDGQTFTKRYDRVKYRGDWKDCDDHIRIDGSGNGCNCPFVACTGSQECTAPDGFFCRFLHDNVDVNDMSREDCACKFLK
ncbi:hypothetical protein OS493_036142 [Desmophyllum pertusum]|uniref:Uncharacterized protein n=1 Tax=Desmophyllum pertusum TaxID=174260 RepID=A0A9W9ZXA8_9CNID|nr:hypothetical protein OS493_036142 [Desmophyllum pertusum]